MAIAIPFCSYVPIPYVPIPYVPVPYVPDH